MGERPHIALWGGFDVENYGDALFPRIFDAEIRRRLPGAEIRCFAPFGHERRPLLMNRDWPMEALAAPDPRRLQEIAAWADLVVIGGGEIVHVRDDLLATVYGLRPEELTGFRPSELFLDGLGRDLEHGVEVAWHGVGVPFELGEPEAGVVRAALARRTYTTVRDRGSLDRLSRAGVAGPVEVVPDSAVLLDRVFSPALLDHRLEALRASGAFPARDPAMVIQGAAHLAEHAEAIARALGGRDRLVPVLVATGPALGDGRFLDALGRHLGPDVHRLPPSAGPEDIAAAIRASSLYVGSSLHGAITALVYRRPLVVLNVDGRAKLDGVSAELGFQHAVVHEVTGLAGHLATAAPPVLDTRLAGRLDAHFDRLAELAGSG